MRNLVMPLAALGLLASGAAYAAQAPHRPAFAAEGAGRVQQASAAFGGARFQPALEGNAESNHHERQAIASVAGGSPAQQASVARGGAGFVLAGEGGAESNRRETHTLA